MKNKKGITLTSLVVTVIILIILAAVGIGTLGPNGLIAKAEEAKEQAQIDDEKEIVGTSVVQSVGKNRYGNIEKEELEIYIEKNSNNRETEVIDDEDKIYVHFQDSGRYYEIDAEGDVREVEVIIDEYPGDITLGINGEKLDGTEEKPFEIWCIEDLVEWSENYIEYKTSYIRLGRTLNFNSKLSYTNGIALGCTSIEELIEILTNEAGTGFTPIAEFSGNFDGQNFAIDNIYINRADNAALFVNANYAKIQNLTISGKIMSSTGTAAGIANYALGINCKNCTNKADIIANGYSAGGIIAEVGHLNIQVLDTIIEECYNYGDISGAENSVGGIIGLARVYNSSSNIVINNCANYGNINNDNIAGGIAGRTQNGIIIKNCYNAANTVIKGKDVGGIVGFRHGDVVYNSYNLGSVEGTSCIGGIVRI